MSGRIVDWRLPHSSLVDVAHWGYFLDVPVAGEVISFTVTGAPCEFRLQFAGIGSSAYSTNGVLLMADVYQADPICWSNPRVFFPGSRVSLVFKCILPDSGLEIHVASVPLSASANDDVSFDFSSLAIDD